MTVSIAQQFPEIRISVFADVGDVQAGEAADYVSCVTETGFPTSWQVNQQGTLNVTDENGTATVLEVQYPSGTEAYVFVYDENGDARQLDLVNVINLSTGGVAGNQNIVPGQVAPAPGSGNIPDVGGPSQ